MVIQSKKAHIHSKIQEESNAEPTPIHHIPQTSRAVVLRVPRPNTQIIILGLVALITLFQTFQLIRISSKSSTSVVKTTPASLPSSSTPDSNAGSSEPQSMVGGC